MLLSHLHATSFSGEGVIRTCPFLAVRLKTLSRTLPSNDWKWRALRRRSVHRRTCAAAHTCIPSQRSRCLDYRTQSNSRSSRRGSAGGQSQRIATCSELRSPRWTGLKWSRPMPTNRNSGEPTTPSSRAAHRAKARRVRWDTLMPCAPRAAILRHELCTQTWPGPPRVGDARSRRRSVTKLFANLHGSVTLSPCQALGTTTHLLERVLHPI